MGISKRWSRIEPDTFWLIPDAPGAYEIGDRHRRIIDIGSSENLAERIPNKLRDQKFKGQARYFRFIEDDDPEAIEAELQVGYIARYGEKPRFTGRVQGEVYEILEGLED